MEWTLALEQEGYGEIDVVQSIPDKLQKYLTTSAVPLALKGHAFDALMQSFNGAGFSVWHSRYWTTKHVVIRARGGTPMLELRIALKNRIGGTWERIFNAELQANYFHMAFVPYVVTCATFDPDMEYETFDIHFELSFLEELGIDYKLLDRFLNQIKGHADQPAELSARPYRCPPIMMDAIYAILHNSFSPAGRARLLKSCVTTILLTALEEVGKEEIKKLPLSPADVEALHHVRSMIEHHCPIYLGNDVLVEKARPALNAFKLSYGFKRLFGDNPEEYYLQLRLAMGKQLLREGYSVAEVANRLEYESPSAFIRSFGKRFGISPGQYKKDWRTLN